MGWPSLKSLTMRASGTTALPGATTNPRAWTHRFPSPKAGRLSSPSSWLPGETHPLAIEYPGKGALTSGATARKGQSYISRNGTTWRDTTSLYRRSNVCLKAFAD